MHIAEGGGQDVPAAPECPGGGERVLRSAVKLFADLASDPPPLRRAGAIERDHRRSGQPGPATGPSTAPPGVRTRNSGLILLRSGRTSHGALAVIVTQRQDLDTDVGAMRR